MANPIKGEVAFEAGGQAYTLVFTIDAVCTLETLVDKPLRLIGAQIDQGRVSAQRAALWAGLRERHPNLTLREAGELIPRIVGRTAKDIVAEGLKLAFGTDEAGGDGSGGDADADPPKPGVDGTGQPS